MCRLLAMTAGRSRPLAEHLGEDLDRFVALSQRHSDGWGLASSSGGEPELAKRPERALDSDLFARLATESSAQQFLLHLRMASPNKINTVQNTHPFVSSEVPRGHPDLAFAHNGHVFDNDSLNRRLHGISDRRPLGETDSEAYFFILSELLAQGAGATRALVTAMGIVAEATEYTSLNAVLSMPEGLYAIHAAHPDPRQGDLDRRPDPGQFTLEYRVDGDLAVVASNDWEHSSRGWHQLPNDHVLFLPAGGAEAIVIGVREVLLDAAA